MAAYKHLFFDLDHTLWDFKTNSRAALESIFDEHLNPINDRLSFNKFYYTYIHLNDMYWQQYRVGKVSKSDLRIGRFRDSLQRFGIEDNDLSEIFASEYVQRSPYQTSLFPEAHKTLSRLMSSGYEMHIITNGFEEVQHIKIRESGLGPFFREVITSEQIGQRKPHPSIFEYALDKAGAQCTDSIMIGDSMEADIIGARDFGMDQVFFNPEGNKHDESPTHEIQHLKELIAILIED